MSYRCEHGKDSDICVQCWEEKNLEPKDMTTPNQPTGQKAESRSKLKQALKAEPELEKAIEELSSFGKDEVVTQDMIDVCKSLDIVLSAAKRLKAVEKERDDWKTCCANRDITVNRQGEDWVKAKTELDSERGAHSYTKGQLFQLRTEYKQALEALVTCETIEYEPELGLFETVQSYNWDVVNNALSTPSAIAAMKE